MTSFKIFLGASFLILLELTVFSEAMMTGGFTEARKPDQSIINLVNKVRTAIENAEERVFKVFQPVSYVQQIVAGTNYWIKVKHDDGYMHVKVFRPLPHTGEPPVLEDYQMGKDVDDSLTPFYQNRS